MVTAAELLRQSFVALEVDDDATEAMLSMQDGSRLRFHHRVGERWARSSGPDERSSDGTLAGRVLAVMARFRLNRKHLEIEFSDGSHWEAGFGNLPRAGTRGPQADDDLGAASS